MLALNHLFKTTSLSQFDPWATPRFWLSIGIGLAMLVAVLLPLNLLATQRFHHDEALYATWALEIASGENPTLYQIPVDKPPLFLYTVAGSLWLLGNTETAARLPSLLATILAVGLTFCLGQKLYNNATGLVAAWLVALSPFTILFAPTAFTDPMLVMLVLAACVAAAYGRAGWAGIFLGLAIATKQQAIFFVPLVTALLIPKVRGWDAGVGGQHITTTRHAPHPTAHTFLNFFLAIFLTLLPILLWDILRNQSPGFWQLSLINYGGLNNTIGQFGERWREFVNLLTYTTASPILNIIFIAGLPLLLGYGMISQRSNVPTFQRTNIYHDWIFTLFVLGFLLVHTWFSFQVWDRYLLGLVPFLALLLARVLILPWIVLKQFWLNQHSRFLPVAGLIYNLALVLLLASTLARPVQDAINGRYPLGSHSQALSGIEQIVAYLQGHADADTTLYHRWLGMHWRFYLWDYPYDLQYWSSPDELASHVNPGHLIAFPSWHSDTEARFALAEAGFDLHELARGYTPLGNPSVVLYQIVAKEKGCGE
jgi:Gpi18-like mannosyltransferase